MKKLIFALAMLVGVYAQAAGTSHWHLASYNGTNLVSIYNGATNNIFGATSTNPTYFAGPIILTNSAIMWDDSLESASVATRVGVTDISYDDALAGEAYAATATTNAANDHLTFTFQLPHRRKVGSDIIPHVHFWQQNADHTNIWYCYYAWVGIGETNVVDTFIGPASNVVSYTSGTIHQLANFPTITGTGKGISSKLRLKLHRNGASGTGSIVVTDVDVHYQVDGFGSDQPASKSY